MIRKLIEYRARRRFNRARKMLATVGVEGLTDDEIAHRSAALLASLRSAGRASVVEVDDEALRRLAAFLHGEREHGREHQ